MSEDSSNKVRGGGRLAAILGMLVACGAYVLVSCTTMRPTSKTERSGIPSCHCVEGEPETGVIFDLGDESSKLKRCVLQGEQVTFDTNTTSTYTVTFDGGSPFVGVNVIEVTKDTPSQNRLKPVPPGGDCYSFTVNSSSGNLGEPMNGTLEVATSGGGEEPPNKP